MLAVVGGLLTMAGLAVDIGLLSGQKAATQPGRSAPLPVLIIGTALFALAAVMGILQAKNAGITVIGENVCSRDLFGQVRLRCNLGDFLSGTFKCFRPVRGPDTYEVRTKKGPLRWTGGIRSNDKLKKLVEAHAGPMENFD